MTNTAETLLEALIMKKYGNISNFSKDISVPEQVIKDAIIVGVAKAPAADLFVMCRALNIDAEELVQNRFRYCTYEERQQAWAEYRQKNKGDTTM